MFKDTAFYDKESAHYSAKRYPTIPLNYIHFFFKRRLALAIDLISRVSKGEGIIEVGCADGYVLRELYIKGVSKGPLIGIDLSKEMIDIARDKSKAFPITYYERGKEPINLKTPLLIEIGVINFSDLESELRYAKDHVMEGGYLIVSFASRTSLKNKLKPAEAKEYVHLESQNLYRQKLCIDFDIVAHKPYGLFIPYIWRLPAVARTLQPILDGAVGCLFPSLLHEEIYLARRKRS